MGISWQQVDDGEGLSRGAKQSGKEKGGIIRNDGREREREQRPLLLDLDRDRIYGYFFIYF